MSRPNEQPDQLLEPKAPQGLIDDLAALGGDPGAVPPEVDHAVIGRAREHFVRRRRVRMALRLAKVGAAAAAVIVAAFWIAQSYDQARPQQQVAVREDIDGNGQVNILDAFVLARRLETAAPTQPGWDVNDDGLIDKRDVDTVAYAAVSLQRGT